MNSIQPPRVTQKALAELAGRLTPAARQALGWAVNHWVKVKQAGGKVLVATGSGPHLHEGVTTLLAELVRVELVDAVLTSAAVVGHELAGGLERVKRVDGAALGLAPETLPIDGKREVALLPPGRFEAFARELPLDRELYERMLAAPGASIIKVAGNLAYPSGLWAERLAERCLPAARAAGGAPGGPPGAGRRPPHHAGGRRRRGIPCLVTTPQLVGGGAVGLCLGDSLPLSVRSALLAKALAEADLIVESGVALTQEIHDGPFELHTGHGLWASAAGRPTFSLAAKRLVRIDLDPALAQVWRMERERGAVARAIAEGRPKAAELKVPFRMEMSGFARLAGSLPLTADLGVAWPVLAGGVARRLGVKLEFMCYKQGTPLGEAVREYIVEQVTPLDPARLPA